MNQRFKEWLIRDSDEWSHQEKQNFLRMAKFRPDKAVQIISDNIWRWGTAAMCEIGSFDIFDVDSESREIFAAWQEHFANELAAITE
jgi:hypothetical protein